MSIYERHEEEVDTRAGDVVQSTRTSRLAVSPGRIQGGPWAWPSGTGR